MTVKMPPNDEEAEMCVLGSMMIEAEAVVTAISMISASDFYYKKHEKIFQAMAKLFLADEPVDIVSLTKKLGNEIEAVGGAYYLTSLVDKVPSAANIEFYANIVYDKSCLRALIETSSKIQQAAYEVNASPGKILENNEESLFKSVIKKGEGYKSLGDQLPAIAEKLEEIHNNKAGITGLSTTYEEIDKYSGGLEGGDLIILAGPTSNGKTAFALNIAYRMAKKGIKVGFVSLEMISSKLIYRLLALDAVVDSNKIRGGTLGNDEWAKLSAAFGRISTIPIYIDDKRGQSLIQIKAKAKRAKMKYGIDLLVVDYLGLIKSESRYNNRNIELGNVSSGLREIGGNMNIPVIALHQLSREATKGKFRFPKLNDLYECLTENALLINADNGQRISIKNVKPGMKVLSMNEREQKIVPGTIEKWYDRGIKKCYRITLNSGRQLECTLNHPIYTENGFKELKDIKIDEDIAIGTGKSITYKNKLSNDLCRMLGYMIGDGSCLNRSHVGFTANFKDYEVINDFKEIIKSNFEKCEIREGKRFGAKQLYVVEINKNGWGKPFGNSFREFLREVGLHGKSCYNKRVPEIIFESNLCGIANYVFGYLQTDGTVKKAYGDVLRISFSSVSYGLINDLQSLLLRLGIPSKINKPSIRKSMNAKPLYTLNISSAMEVLNRFAEIMPNKFRKMNKLNKELNRIGSKKSTSPGAMSLPRSVSILLAEKTKKLSYKEKWYYKGKRTRKDLIKKWAKKLNDTELMKWATSDLFWDSIVKIEEIGDHRTYDITIKNNHSFLANDIVVHNSGHIEQDADAVWFITRPELHGVNSIEVNGEMHDTKDLAVFQMAKNREGQVNKYIPMRFDAFCTRFSTELNRDRF